MGIKAAGSFGGGGALSSGRPPTTPVDAHRHLPAAFKLHHDLRLVTTVKEQDS